MVKWRIAGVALLAATLTQAAVLIENGRSDYRIVLPDGATAQERYAAGELADHLAAMSGVRLVVLEESAAGDAPCIAVGATRIAAAAGVECAELADEEVVSRTDGNGNLILAGGKVRGTMYAVYDFLERQLGCHWFDEFTVAIPRRERIEIPELDRHYRPYFLFRHVAEYIPSNQVEFMRFHLRSQGSNTALLSNYTMIGAPAGVHTFYLYSQAIPPERSDLWSMDENGVRQPPQGPFGPELCLSNPDAAALFTEELRKYIRQEREHYDRFGFPYPTLYDISQNDGYAYFCRCPECLAVIDRCGGEPSGLLLTFINRIAGGIRDEFPDVKVQTLAYVYAKKPPTGIVPADNVFIRYCTTADRFGLAFGAPGNEEVSGDIVNWGKLTPNLGVWMYWFYFKDTFPMPSVAVDQFQDDFRFLAANRVQTVYVESKDFYRQSFFALHRWLAYQLMQDPELDAEKLIAVFMRGYYGAAASAMEEYYRLLTACSAELNESVFDPGAERPRPYLTPEFFARCDALLTRAEQAAAGDALMLRNVRRERAIVDGAWLHLRKQRPESTPEQEAAVLERYADYRYELLETVIDAEFQPTWRPMIENELRQLRHADEIEVTRSQPPPEMLIPYVPERDWKQARVVDQWYENFGVPSTRHLQAELLHDGKNLLIRLRDDDVNRELKSSDSIWDADDWELHFTSDSAAGPLRMIAVSPYHGEIALEMSRHPGGMADGGKTILTDYAAVTSLIGDGCWQIEVEIPFDRLLAEPLVPGRNIYMNFFRAAHQNGEAQSWSPTFDASFHIPWRLGKAFIGSTE